MSDRKFLEELLQCLRQQQAELEEGRRLLSQLQRSASRDASSQTSPLRSPASSSSSLAGRVLDLSDVYQQCESRDAHVLLIIFITFFLLDGGTLPHKFGYLFLVVLDTRGHTLASRDNLKKYHSRRGTQQGIESEP